MRHSIQEISRQRGRGTRLDVVTVADTALVGVHYPSLPRSTLDDLHGDGPNSAAQIEAGREPWLLTRLSAEFGTDGFIALWDHEPVCQRVGTGRSYQHKEMVAVTTARGDLLLSPDTLVFWR